VRPVHKLALYGGLLGAVLAGSVAVGNAAEPVGLSTVEPEPAGHGAAMDGMVPGLAAAADGLRLVPETDAVDAGTPTPYRFRILDEDGPVTDFEIEHTKPMHLVVVRRDLMGFVHQHPTMAADGTWTTTLTLPDAGAYRVYADFAVDGDHHTLGIDLFVDGEFRPVALQAPAPIADAGDGYIVTLDGRPVAGEESTLAFTVHRDGQVVDDLETYLGARGHLVALRDGDLAYLHVHADEERLSFDAEFPTPGAYRLFLQFQVGGQVRTAAFTVEAEEASR
jgi:hypothetical protein